MKKAVLFLIFNRLDTTKRVFEKIKEAKPPRLYLASDGAREEKKGERETVEEVRSFVLKNINWDCRVETLFREKNLGCGKAVSSAINWFFNQERDGIILEDDCLPDKTFFTFCEELLDYYKNESSVMHISGDQFIPNFKSKDSYYFAKNMHCWGWASWSDRWRKYQFEASKFSDDLVKNISSDKNVQKYWLEILRRLKKKEIDTWDYQWAFSIINNKGFCINPSVNLISNIGFGLESTHTGDSNNPFANMPTFEIKKINHPKKIKLNQEAVDYIFQNHFNIEMEKKNFFISAVKKFLKF